MHAASTSVSMIVGVAYVEAVNEDGVDVHSSLFVGKLVVLYHASVGVSDTLQHGTKPKTRWDARDRDVGGVCETAMTPSNALCIHGRSIRFIA